MSNTAKKISEFEKLIESKRNGSDDVSVYWFVARGSVLKGPFTEAELGQRLDSKEISAHDYAWRQGFAEWRPLGSTVEYLDTHKKEGFETYPSLPVPGKGQAAIKEQKEESPKKRKDVEVRLRTANKNLFTPQQGAVIVIFAIFFAYVTNQWFLGQVLGNISTFFETRTAGKVLMMGEDRSSHVHPEIWTPLYSAPGYNEVKQKLDLPVHVYGLPKKIENKYNVEGQTIDSKRTSLNKDLNFSHLDPIFVRPVDLYGNLNPQHPQNLRVKQLGEPFLESFWEN